MRIRSLDDISHLGKHAQKQISKQLVGKQISVDKRFLNLPTSKSSKSRSEKTVIDDKPFHHSVLINSKKQKAARINKTFDGLNYCPYPNSDPSVWLHIALIKAFGSWDNGGELVDEMILPGHDVRFRFDFCLPRFKFAIEVDGYGYHRDLKSFKRDREKQKHALINGWVVHRLTSSNIKNEFNSLLPDIKSMLKYRQKCDATIINVGKTWCALK